MKKTILSLILAVVAVAAVHAQQISVVASNGSTKLYRTLEAAIKGADPNSVIYLPGGGFPIADSVKITKKLTIIGIGHKAKNDNVDGITTISGNLFFNQGSSGSAVMGCYITGTVYVGDDGNAVNDVMVKFCNIDRIYLRNSKCFGTIVNQNYILSRVTTGNNDNNVAAEITNNVVNHIYGIDGGIISNNVITGASNSCLAYVSNSTVSNNIFLKVSSNYANLSECSSNSYNGNMGWGTFSGDEDYINLSSYNKSEVFVNYSGSAVSPASDFHFKSEFKQYENQVGIYAGDGFNDKQLAPVPYIVAKKIDEQTDAAGKLNIKIRVKASGEE